MGSQVRALHRAPVYNAESLDKSSVSEGARELSMTARALKEGGATNNQTKEILGKISQAMVRKALKNADNRKWQGGH